MPNYDFLNLSPIEFEDLSRDLLQKKMNIILESFTSGRDQGIDFRYSKDKDNSLIIQCKKYKTFNNLHSNLKKEVEKLQKIHCQRYLLATAVGLTPNQKDTIKNLFDNFINSTEDIFGRNDLNNLLGLYPEIEKSHFKLWLSSINILDKIIHSKVYNQTEFEENEIKELINIYVINQSFKEALNIINKNHFVIISGIPGIGKTTLARILVYNFLASDFEEFIFLSDSIAEGYKLFQDGKKQIFLFDDFLGRNFLENNIPTNEEKQIIKFIQKIKKHKNKIIIFTTREYILNQAKLTYDLFNDEYLDFAKCIIDLSKYSKFQKAKILYNHLYFSDLSVKYIDNLLENNRYINIIKHHNYNPRIIEIITRKTLESIKPENYYEEFIRALDNPQAIWKHAYENQISAFSKCILAILLISERPILVEDLELSIQNFSESYSHKYGITSYSNINYKNALKELENSFILTEKDSENNTVIHFQNPSIYDFLINYLREAKSFIKDLINCSVYFEQLFGIFSIGKNEKSKIYLTDELVEILIDKFIRDFDNLKIAKITRSYIYTRNNGFIWRKQKNSVLYKLYKMINKFDVKEFLKLKEFIKKKFPIKLCLENLSSKEKEYYVTILDILKDDIILNKQEVIEHIAQHINNIDDINNFKQFELIYPDEYCNYIQCNRCFNDLIYRIIDSEVKAYITPSEALKDHLEELRETVQEIEEEFGIDMEEVRADIEYRIERENSMDEEEDILDSDDGKIPLNNKDSDEDIVHMFNSLISEK